MKMRFISIIIGGLAAIGFNAGAQPFIPGGAGSAGLTNVVPDMAVWYNSHQLTGSPFSGYVTNGPVDRAAQVDVTSQANGNWEPYVSVMGNTTFLIGAGIFADDGSWAGSTNLMGSRPNQRYIVTLQPAGGGAPRVGEVFYDDFGQPYRLHAMMRQRNPGVRVAGDKRNGATNFIAGGTAALLYGKFWFGIDYFNTDGRYSTSFPLYGTGFGSVNNQDGAGNPAGTSDFQSVSVQTYSLNPATLDQSPLTKAFDSTYGMSWRNQVPVELCNNAGLPCGNGGAGSDNEAYFGGDLAALDNGNFVVVVNDYTGFFATNRIAQPSAVATIVRPDGSVVKDTWLVDPREIWSNVAAYRGGFCVRVQTTFYFYDNAGILTATNTVASSGVGYDTGRGDGARIASDIRSHYVYLSTPVAVPGGIGVGLGVWDARTGAFVTNAIVSSDLDPAAMSRDRVGLAVDGLDRICVAYNGKPDAAVGFQDQVIARVLKFDGVNVSFLTPSFFPFVNSDTNSTAILGFKTTNPNVAMTTEYICIAAKGIINSTNNPAGGPDTAPETTVYTVINQPPFVPGGLGSAGLTNIVADRIIFKSDTANQDNWEPNISVLGNSTFLVEANTYATDGASQRYALAFQPVAGGPNATGEVFYADNGAPYRDQINLSRQNGNPGRVAGDKRPGAVNFIGGGEASLYGFPAAFNSDGRFDASTPFYTFLSGANGRDSCIQIHSLNPTTLAQTPRSKALDSAFARLTNSTPPTGASVDQISRFGGELAGLDNGNFVSVVEDRSRLFNPNANAAVATIFRPDGSIVKDAFKVADGDLWSNLAAYRGGFCVRVAGTLYFYDNNGNLSGSTNQIGSGVNFDPGRGDGTRIASDINSPFVYLAGIATTAAGDPAAARIAVFDSRNFSFVAATNVSEATIANVSFDRANLAVDGLDRVTVAYELTLRFGDPPTPGQQQVVARVLAFDPGTKTFRYLTPSFYPFVNFDTSETALIRSQRPSIAMTTRQICIAAKGEINSTNNPAAGPDTLRQTTFYTVISHPDPQSIPVAVTPPGDQLYDDPSGGWTYVLNGSSATAGPGGTNFTSLDGTWSHDNGSDTWDGSAIGGAFVAGSNAPGGVSSIDGYLRIEDSGDPRTAGFADPGNRKIYFGHNITAEGASGTVLNDGVTLHFRTRIATAGLLDDRFITAQTNYPAGGDGYLIHDSGKGNFGIKQANGGIVSFSLATSADTPLGPGLVMNNRNGTANSADVDTGEAGTANVVALDPTKWHEFWITIRADTTGQATHRVDVYLDGSLVPRTFYVTAGTGDDFAGISYIATGCGSTAQSGAFDVVQFFSPSNSRYLFYRVLIIVI